MNFFYEKLKNLKNAKNIYFCKPYILAKKIKHIKI